MNTSLQRQRCIALSQIFEYNLQPGCLLDLEVEYTFDERLLLKLVAKTDREARFPLEVSSDADELIDIVEIDIDQETLSFIDQETLSFDEISKIIPCIPRVRNESPVSPGLRVSFKDWQVLATTLTGNWTNGKQQELRRRITTQTARAENRIEIIYELIRWLEMSYVVNSALVNTQAVISVMALSNIFQSLDMNNSRSSQAEEKFKDWIRRQFENCLSNLAYELFNQIAETPGKLFWSDFDESLIQAFNSYKIKPMSHAFLNSLAKCGRPTQRNLSLLHQVIKHSQHLGHKEKAAWALGRLISPGQPEEWKANFKDVENTIKLALDQLYHHTTEPQVAQNLLVCLSQGLAWRINGERFSPEICDQVRRLPDTPLPVERRLIYFHKIQESFEKRLSIIPKMLELEKASSDDIRDIHKLLSDSINNG